MTQPGLYIHIPFCKKKCDYCDFASVPIDAAADALIDEYLTAMQNEMGHVRAIHELPLTFSTIFIGGGTPTILNEDQLIRLSGMIHPLCLSPLARGRCPEQKRGTEGVEFTIEGNPDSITLEKLKLLRDFGVSRLSIGAQSFNNDELKTLGRIHNSKQIFEAFKNARNAGFENINIDLIFGIPGQTLESWKITLDIAIELGPGHLSCYGLQIEEGTPFYERYINYDLDGQYEMYKHTIDFLKSQGYHHYEISNFAKPGFECKHNINYWKNGNYLGIGASAASHMDGKRWENPKDIKEYMDQYPLSASGGVSPLLRGRQREAQRGSIEITGTILMNLRLLEGIDLAQFEKRFGKTINSLYDKEIGELISLGLLEIKSGRMRLAEKGLYLGNKVFASFV